MAPPRPGRQRAFLTAGLIVVTVAVVAALVAFAYDRGRSGNDDRKAARAAQTATRSAEVAAVASAAAILTAAAPTKTPPATPTAAATPTPPPPTPTATVAPSPTVAVTSTPLAPTAPARSGGATTIAGMLPLAPELPAGLGLAQSTDGKRTNVDEIATSFTDPVDAKQKLQGWGWKGNVFRSFTPPPGSKPAPQRTSFLEVSIHRFGSAQAATEALTYFSDSVVASQGLQDAQVEPLGDQSRALAGAPQAVNLVVLYVRSGPILIRIGGSSPQGDPTADVVALAKTILAK